MPVQWRDKFRQSLEEECRKARLAEWLETSVRIKTGNNSIRLPSTLTRTPVQNQSTEEQSAVFMGT